jgi:enterochelin esterase-like enzyme
MVKFAALLMAAIVSVSSAGAQTPAAELRLVEMARTEPASPAFREAVTSFFSQERLKAGNAYASYQGQFLFAVSVPTPPVLMVNDQLRLPFRRLAGEGDIWVVHTVLETGRSHRVEVFAGGKHLREAFDVAAYTEDSYDQPGVAQGTLSEKITLTSKIYPGMTYDMWFYVADGVDLERGAPVMVWQDGEKFASYDARPRLLQVTDNLVHKKKIPPMIHVLVSPGMVDERRMRSIQYDSVTDTYLRFILEEVLPEVNKRGYRLRRDGYSRAIGGESSGGICAFNAAWHNPDAFSRVLSRIGSYTSIQWRRNQPNLADNLDGGNVYPFKVRKEDKRNIRVWLEDGSYDLENNHGSWPLQNIQMANSLKMGEYDFYFSWGNHAHSTAWGNAELPRALEWLWRGYDPEKSQETYVMDPAEKTRPMFRVRSLNR